MLIASFVQLTLWQNALCLSKQLKAQIPSVGMWVPYMNQGKNVTKQLWCLSNVPSVKPGTGVEHNLEIGFSITAGNEKNTC